MKQWFGIKKDHNGSYMMWVDVCRKRIMFAKSWYTDKYYVGVLTMPK